MSKYAYEYKPYEERTPDEQYKDMIRTILKEGKRRKSAMVGASSYPLGLTILRATDAVELAKGEAPCARSSASASNPLIPNPSSSSEMASSAFSPKL